MSSSKYKIVNRWSTPSIDNFGIDGLFQQSDQRHYLHKCTRCNHWNQMKYEDYNSQNLEKSGNILCVNPDGIDKLAKTVVEGSFQYVCQKCGKPLDRWYNGEWVAKYPSRTPNLTTGVRGYFIGSMNAVWVSLDTLKTKELEAKSKQSFYNYTLGFPYTDSSISVNPNDVLDNVYQGAYKKNREGYKFVACGIDWGSPSWVTLYGITPNGQIELMNLSYLEKPTMSDIGGIGSDLESLRLFLKPYDPDIIVADVGDSGDKITRLMKMYGKDKVFGCIYKSTPRSTGELVPNWQDNKHTVSVDKLMQHKRFITKMKEGEIRFPDVYKVSKLMQEFVYHWQNVKIRTEEDLKTGELYEVITAAGDDHYASSSIYAFLGLERLVDIYISNGTNAFNSTNIDLIQSPMPTPTDIYNQY